MNNAIDELFAVMGGILLVALVFAWFALLPTLGLLWVFGWLS